MPDPSKDSAPGVTFLAAARDALAPRDAFGRAVLALVALRAPLVWLVSHLGRGEPLSVTALYRPGGDIQYYELVAGMSRANLGETNLYESAGQGLHSFPFGSIWLHALLFRPFGAWGLLLADVIITVLGYVALVMLGRASRLSARASAAFGAFVCGYLYVALTPLTNRLGWMPDLFWGDRFPRPFLTEIYAVWSYAVLLRLWLGRRDERETFGLSFWAFAAIVFTLLFQSDLYTAFIVGLGYAVIVGERLLRRPDRRRETARGVVLFVLILAATAWPLAIQQLATPPSLLVRWGVYPISRVRALLWARYIPFAGPLLVALVAAAVLTVIRRVDPERTGANSAEEDRAGARDVVHYYGLLAALATLAFPLFFILTGKGLYPYHSADRLRRVTMFCAAYTALLGLTWAFASPRLAKLRRLETPFFAALVIAMAAGLGARAIDTYRREDHVRTWYKLGPGVHYRAAFTDLVRELDAPRYRDAVVLGTLDQMVHVHWQAFKGGRSFVPDGWISVAPNEEMERRFILFARAIGATADEYLQMAQGPGHSGLIFDAKYATNREYTLFPLSDYTEEQRKRIQARSLFTAFAFELPISEKERMRRVYNEPAQLGPMPRLDLLVLNNDAEVGHLAPPETDFQLTYKNAHFRVYARRPAP